MNWYLAVLKKYACFSGRARHKEYWYFVLFQLIAILLISFLERTFAVANPEVYAGWYTAFYILLTLIPFLAVQVRRLHDANFSGWWALIHLIPFIGQLVMLIFALLPGTVGENRYGADPRK
ncbi:DUF805 domain-containing protein [Serratia microhaemolytica]|uniref:DUF805 domain-containing protein n=1 Tax=Serratia microhaemolytica TaxID=2675110 RepID=UPI000FDD40D0|nr:DUF805 domain-containing protein [Serratia microhaemolytica]